MHYVYIMLEFKDFVSFSGGERLYRDIEAMIGYKPFIVWRIMWQFVTPLIVFVSCLLLSAVLSVCMYDL